MKWITWLLDNLWAAVVVVGVIAQLFQAIFKRKNDGSQDPRSGESPPPASEYGDPELAEHTRRIREDIERRRQQRSGGPADAPPVLTQPEPIEAPPLIREIEKPRPAVPAVTVAESRRQAEVLEEQAALLEKLREAEVLKLAARKRREFEAATADHSGAARTESRSVVMGDLRSPAALRRAFILREVLGPPVALRR